jgi:adenosylmethionine-8-amino-7-oxononanoate aminotransferase
LAGDTVAFCPPLIVSKTEIDEIWKRFGTALDLAASRLKA